MKIESIQHINSLKDLRREKLKLHKKLLKRQVKFIKRLSGIQENISTDKILSGISEKFGIKSDLIGLILPVIFKYGKHLFNMKIVNTVKKNPKKTLLIGVAGLSLGLLGYLLYRSLKKRNHRQPAYSGNINPENTYYDDDTFRYYYDEPEEVIF